MVTEPKLPQSTWFHYSGDYRIGTKYLEEPILDNIKRQAMRVDFLRDLLRHLGQVQNEAEVIGALHEVLAMLFAPRAVAYLRVDGKKTSLVRGAAWILRRGDEKEKLPVGSQIML